MDKQKQIEEMAKVLDGYWGKNATCPFDKKCPYLGGSVRFTCNDCMRANAIYNASYRKIPENAVVLTREELFRDSTQLSKEKQIETIHNIILENLDYGYEETARAIYDANYRKIPKLGVILPFDHYDNLLKTNKEVRKETAEKFAEMAKAKAIKARVNIDDHPRNDSFIFLSDIDEICKEITEVKV